MNFFQLKKIEIKRSVTFSSTIIFLMAIIFTIMVNSGIYGYGTDYYHAYTKGFEWNRPAAESSLFDYLGYRIVTLTINGFYVGVCITTFILSISTGLLIREYIKSRQRYSLVLFLILFIVAIHTWPVIMSTSNSMRQGLTMSFIFLALISNYHKNYYWMIFFSVVAIFMHKSGILFSVILFYASILDKLLDSLSYNKKTIISFFIGTLSLIVNYYLINTFLLGEGFVNSKIIAGDFRFAFVLISIIFILFSFVNKNILNNSFNSTLYHYSFISLAFLMSGLNWQYERLGMMMLIPYILSFGFIINKSSYGFYLILSFLALLFLTIYNDMYAIGLLTYIEFYLDNI